MLISSKERIKSFVHGGKAIFTLENRFTGNRFTYKVSQKKGGDIFWVSLLNGPDNTSNYRFFGTIFPSGFKHSPNGKIGEDAKSVVVWKWFYEKLMSGGEFPLQFEFHHSNRCGRCGRLLTTPDSVSTGFGEECRAHLAVGR